MKANLIYIVSVIKKPQLDTQNGVEIAGTFTSLTKAEYAKTAIERWLKQNDFNDGVVMIYPCDIDKIAWYDMTINMA